MAHLISGSRRTTNDDTPRRETLWQARETEYLARIQSLEHAVESEKHATEHACQTNSADEDVAASLRAEWQAREAEYLARIQSLGHAAEHSQHSTERPRGPVSDDSTELDTGLEDPVNAIQTTANLGVHEGHGRCQTEQTDDQPTNNLHVAGEVEVQLVFTHAVKSFLASLFLLTLGCQLKKIWLRLLSGGINKAVLGCCPSGKEQCEALPHALSHQEHVGVAVVSSGARVRSRSQKADKG